MKSKATVVVLLATGIILGYLSFIAWSAGFLLIKYLGSNKVGEPSKVRSYFIPLGRYKIHLHHWLLSSCAIIIFTVCKGACVLPSDLFYGFFGAIVFHGIYFYSDWHRILIPRQVQSLVAAKSLAVEKITFATSLLEMKQEIEKKLASPRIYSRLPNYEIHQMRDSGSPWDRGLEENIV